MNPNPLSVRRLIVPVVLAMSASFSMRTSASCSGGVQLRSIALRRGNCACHPSSRLDICTPGRRAVDTPMLPSRRLSLAAFFGIAVALGSGRLAPVTVAQPHQVRPPAVASPDVSGVPPTVTIPRIHLEDVRRDYPAETRQNAGDAVHTEAVVSTGGENHSWVAQIPAPFASAAPPPAGGHPAASPPPDTVPQLMVCH